MKRKRQTQWKDARGQGSVFFFVTEAGEKLSPSLYISYRAEGREQKLSAGTDDLEAAKKELRRLLRNRENAKAGLEPLIAPKTERVTVGELLDANERRMEEQGKGSIKSRTKTLKARLGSVRALRFRAEHVDAYKAGRRKEKVSETSIKHELEILDGAFRYAVRRRVLAFVPFIEKPKEDNVRKKEIALPDYVKVLGKIGCPDVRDFAEWLLLTAMRPGFNSPDGVCALLWESFDKQAWELSVPSQKGGDARSFAIDGSLRRIFERRLAVRRLDCPFIFHHRGRRLKGDRTRRIFYAALKACGLPSGRKAGFTPYDTKKTAAGLLIDSGLSEREAMDFSGHKTASMFDRYVIKSAERHRRSLRKRDDYMAAKLAANEAEERGKLAEFPSKLTGH